MNNNEKKISLLISSFDGFSDCWDTFVYGFKKYWNDCSYPIYIITNYRDSPDEDLIKSIKVGEDKGWSANMLQALNFVKTDYILYLQDDYWIDKKVDQNMISSIIDQMTKNKWDYFRLVPIPKANKTISGNDIYGITTSASKYQVSLQAAIWRVDFF